MKLISSSRDNEVQHFLHLASANKVSLDTLMQAVNVSMLSIMHLLMINGNYEEIIGDLGDSFIFFEEFKIAYDKINSKRSLKVIRKEK